MFMAKASRLLLVVEDSDEDYEATLRTLRKIGAQVAIRRCVDGEDALDWLYHRGRYAALPAWMLPSVILLDLNLPAIDGREMLSMIKHDSSLKSIPVVILTTSSNPKDIEVCYQYGANSYLIKPVNLQLFTQQLKLMYDYWFFTTMLPDALG